MKPELIAQKMTEIDDRYVLESDPDTVAATVHRRSRSAAVADFFSHGWGVAIISGFVALSVLGGIPRRHPPPQYPVLRAHRDRNPHRSPPAYPRLHRGTGVPRGALR